MRESFIQTLRGFLSTLRLCIRRQWGAPSPPLVSPPAALCRNVRVDRWSSWCCVRCYNCCNFCCVCTSCRSACRVSCCIWQSSLLPALSQPLLSSYQLSFHRIGFVGTHAGCYETEGFLNVKTVTRLLIYQTGQSSNCPHGNLF